MVGPGGGLRTIGSGGMTIIFFFFQAEDGIRDKLVTGVRRVLFRSQHRAGRSDECEEADADSLIAHQTSRTILPNCSDCSKQRCAAGACASGSVRSTTGVS